MKEQYYYSITNVVWLEFWVRCIVRHIVETQKVGCHFFVLVPTIKYHT